MKNPHSWSMHRPSMHGHYQEKSFSNSPHFSAPQAETQAIRSELKLEADRLRLIQLNSGYKREWVYHELCKLFDLSEGEICWLGEFLEFQRGWAWHRTKPHREQRREAARWAISIEGGQQ